MDRKDLQEFREVMRESIGNALEGGVIPAMDTMMNDIGELKTDVGELKIDVAELKTDVTELKTDVVELKTRVGVITTRHPDKAYLDDKINDLRGDILKGRKADSRRVDKHIEFHHKKEI